MQQRFFSGILIALLAAHAAAAESTVTPLLGARAVLASIPAPAKVANASGTKSAAAYAVADDELPRPSRRTASDAAALRKLKTDLAAFVAQMPRDASAGEHWTALFERLYTLNDRSDAEPVWQLEVPFSALMAALPPPAFWPRIAALLRQHHGVAAGTEATPAQIALLAFADQLAGDAAALRERQTQFEAVAKKVAKPGDYRSAELRAAAQAIEQVVATLAGDDPVARFSAALQRPVPDYAPGLRVPDLVTIAGEGRAGALLLQALTQSSTPLDIPVGEATRALAARLALQNVDKLHATQWNLVRGLDCAPLYEALVKRFGADASSGEPGMMSMLLAVVGGGSNPTSNYRDTEARKQAKANYFVALLSHGRNAEAEAVAQNLGVGSYVSDHALRSLFDALADAGYAKQTFEFLDGYVQRHPNSDLWDRYFEAAARVGQQDAMLAHVRASLNTPEGRAYASMLRVHLIDALLAADKLDEAVAELRALIGDAGILQATRSQYALKLAELGRLYDKPEWVNEGLDADRSTVTASKPSVPVGDIPMDDSRDKTRLRLLRALGRYGEAERHLAQSLVERHAQRGARPDRVNASDMLVELAGVYHDAGRDADVLVLLDRSPDWGVADLASIYSREDVRKVPLGYYAAVALHRAGMDERALPIVRALIDERGGFDPAYALYTQIRGAAAIPYLDQVYARDQFEERPLIWKAQLLLQAKRLDEAERVARAAIAVDPSDGEEGPGDRMRVYAVLTDILQARGNAGDAALYRNAVQAIRESEHADEFRLAGAHTHAIALYAKALDKFSDAYCIQSRLAVELNARGDALQAQEHYRRAYELMPSSFGRMESHCLGCENVFGGMNAQGIAEKVFGDLVKKTPGNPQVHYLFGYLREQQGRYPEALSYYHIATELDADYLNAWKHRHELGDKIDIPGAERDRVDLRLFELDPRHRHTYYDTSKVADWPALYTLAAKLHVQQPAQVGNLYTLAQSKLRLGGAQQMRGGPWQAWHPSQLRAAGNAIGRTTLMQTLGSVMQLSQDWGDDALE